MDFIPDEYFPLHPSASAAPAATRQEMPMNARTVLILALCSASLSAIAADGVAVAPVASIAAVGGQVLLAQGAQIAPAAVGTALYPGDRLMTLENAQVLLAFADGCQRRLEGDALLTLGDSTDCAGSPDLVAFHQAIGESGTARADEDDRKGALVVNANNATGTTATRLTPGQRWAVAAALLIPALYYWDRNRNDDDDRPPVSR
jgi:hypothetical protein